MSVERLEATTSEDMLDTAALLVNDALEAAVTDDRLAILEAAVSDDRLEAATSEDVLETAAMLDKMLEAAS